MTLCIFTFPVLPYVGSKEGESNIVRRVLRVLGGDDPRRRQSHSKEVELEWPVLSEEHSDEIVAFLEARGGDEQFWFTLGNKPPMKCTCDTWEEASNTGGHFSITATFKQSFSLS